MASTKHLFIAGAGFSSHAGLPLTTKFTEELLNVENFSDTGPNKLTVKFLRRFVEDVFEHKFLARAQFWPHLEDLFTTVDLAANSGHHLGPKYSPAQLRVVRRAMIVRIIRMLRQTYTRKKNAPDDAWGQLEKFFTALSLEKCGFLCMNWDTVIEDGLQNVRKIESFDYGCDAIPAKFGLKHLLKVRRDSDAVRLIKMHGSANWLYCDACRQLFWVSPSSTLQVADVLLKDTDWEVISRFVSGAKGKQKRKLTCPSCDALALGTRFATFSYRKALDFPMFERSWLSAEELLRQAETWIFVGYSLPAADYQFKHLLKHVQLSRQEQPKIILVTGGTSAADTLKSYQKFFGPSITKENKNYFKYGLDDAAQQQLRELGALV
jgi:hypothetical protein